MCQLRQLQTQRNGFVTDSKISTHHFLQAYMYNRLPFLSVSLFLTMTFVKEPVGQFKQKIAKSNLGKGEQKSVKMNGHDFFMKYNFELLERRWQK